MSQQVGPYHVVALSPARRLMINMLDLSGPAHNMDGLPEVDVTVAWQFISEHRAHTGETLSFTDFLTLCLARAEWLDAVQGLLHKAYDTYQIAAQSIPETSGEHRRARALVGVGIANLLCEQNDLEAALVHMKQGLALMPMWDKADDSALAYVTLARVHLAQANMSDAPETLEKAIQVIQTSGVFSEARRAIEIAQVKLWLAHAGPGHGQSPRGQHLSKARRRQPDRGGRPCPAARYPSLTPSHPAR